MMIFRMKRQMHISFECFIELQGKTEYDKENWLQIPLGFVRETDFVFGIMLQFGQQQTLNHCYLLKFQLFS